MKKIKIAIDSSSIVNTGGFTHLYNFIKNINIQFENDIESIVIFGSKTVLNKLPKNNILIKKTYWLLNTKKIFRLIFQLFFLDKKLKSLEVDILLSLTGDYIGKFRPYIGISQNMLLYEREFWKEMNARERFKMYLNYKRQKVCFKHAEGIIFLSYYAKNYVTNSLNLINKNCIVIPHGISTNFISNNHEFKIDKTKNSFHFLYVSTVHVYKNQLQVVEAISKLRNNGYNVELTLVGDIIYKPYGNLLKRLIRKVDHKNEFIHHVLNVPYFEISEIYKNFDGIIFASSCENMPNILLESMGSMKPIACSEKGPMIEFLKDGGFYFNPRSISSIYKTLEYILLNKNSFKDLNQKNKNELSKYSWKKTTSKTLAFIKKNLKNIEYV